MCDNGLDSEMYMDSDIINSPTIIDTTKNVTIRAKKTKKNIKIIDSTSNNIPPMKSDPPTLDEKIENTTEILKNMIENEISEKIQEQLNLEGVNKKASDVLSNLGEYIEEPFTIIESYFEGQHLQRLVRHQLESYNHFINFQVQRTIQMFNPVIIHSKYALEVFITFENFNIYRPQIHENNGAIKLMFPQEARLRNFTYAAATTIDINIKYVIRNGPNLENVQFLHKTIPRVHIGKLPIMLKSNICVLNQYKHFDNEQTGECKFDAGGYFIINGSEKTVLGQERAAENRVYCFNEYYKRNLVCRNKICSRF